MSAFTLETVSSIQKNDLKVVFSHLKTSDNKHSNCYESGVSEYIEKNLLNNILQRTIDKKTRLHILYDTINTNKIPCGLIALNFEVVGEFSALSIDLIFISKPYRGIFFDEINFKISSYLLEFALQEAIQINNISKLDAILLTPINECVKEVYLEFGFSEFTDDWLMFSIDELLLK